MIGSVLITGIGGSGGSYLSEWILEHHPDVKVSGFVRWHSASSHRNLAAIQSRVNIWETDLTDFSSVYSALKYVRPDAVVHLAAHANVKSSFQNPLSVMQNNVMGTANLLEAIRLVSPDIRVLICSTSEVYGQVDPANVPITELCPLNPASPYSVSKVAQDLLGQVYFLAYKMPVVRSRAFTYLNPRRSDLFATAFARQIAAIEAGLQTELLHGNLDSVRTIIDVRDAMSAYWLALTKGVPGEVYNIGGDTTLKVGEVLDQLIALAKVPINKAVNPNLLRPADVTLQIPDTTKFKKLTGWSPQYAFKDSLAFLLKECRKEFA